MPSLRAAIFTIACLLIAGCGPKPATPEAVAQPAPSPAKPAAPDLQTVIANTIPPGTAPQDVHRLKADWNGQAVTFVDYPVATNIQLTAFAQTTDSYRTVDIDTLSEEGGTAQIGAIAFANADMDAAKELIVLVTWPVQHATVSGTLYEVRVFDDLDADARPLIALNQHFGSGCDCSGEDADPKRYTFRTVADIRKELTRMGY